MTVDQLKAEARSKPSGVAFRKLSATVYVSVKYTYYPESFTSFSQEYYTWKCGEVEITESRATELLMNL
jgi:hypothetical protein